MSGVAPTILFEAEIKPSAGLSARGLRWLCAVLVGLAGLPATLVVVLGAWPVLPILGLEIALVLGLVALHRRWSRRAVETVRLTEHRLTVRCRDGHGREETHALDAYWARVELTEREASVPALHVRAQGRSVELGRFLGAAEKRDLAGALDKALRLYRDPRFDNPQLR